jgi:hypothetical protein
MNKIVFIDTGAWFAGIAKNDQYHDLAMKHRPPLCINGFCYRTTLDESRNHSYLLNNQYYRMNAQAGRRV